MSTRGIHCLRACLPTSALTEHFSTPRLYRTYWKRVRQEIALHCWVFSEASQPSRNVHQLGGQWIVNPLVSATAADLKSTSSKPVLFSSIFRVPQTR